MARCACPAFCDSPIETELVVAFLLTAVFYLASGNTIVTRQLRKVLKPAVENWVVRGQPVVVHIQKRHKHRVLDITQKVVAVLCSVEFYITFLPFLFWVGQAQLARRMTLFMALCIYWGNVCKDVVCAPRPASPPVRRIDKKDSYDEEYGLPSTHTINTIAMMGYFFEFLRSQQVLTPTGLQIFFFGAVAWCAFMAYGRLYLGMHTPVDIFGGFLVAMWLLWFWCTVDDCLDAWLLSKHPLILPVQLVFTVLAIVVYPKPERETPSKKFAVYFLGVALGIVWACSRSAKYADPIPIPFVHGIHLEAVWPALRRLLVGMPIVLACRSIAKFVALRFGAVVANNNKNLSPVVTTIANVAAYTAVGWSVAEGAVLMFQALNI